MTTHGPKPAAWVLSEVRLLREMIEAGRSAADVAARLNRSQNSVSIQARRLGLSFKKKKTFVTPAERAEELAAKVIDQRIEVDAPAEERATRKRRLLKGPSSFRHVRKDHLS